MSGGFPVTMLPPEAIQVIDRQTKVVIVDPPSYAFGLWVLFLAACVAVAIVLLARGLGVGFAALPFVVALALAAFGSFLATSKSTYTLSRQDGTLKIKHSHGE